MDLDVKFTDGGVCAPAGFKAAGTACGIKGTKDKKDLALIVSACSKAVWMASVPEVTKKASRPI